MLNPRALNLKRKLAEGNSCCGAWLGLACPSICEIVTGSGLDFIVVDAEHSPFNPETQQAMLMAFKGCDTVPIIRVPWNDPIMIKQALDMGWEGVLIPQVNTPDEVRAAVAACRYPPKGKRGWGPRRAADYGRDDAEYAKTADDSVICIVQIEDVRGADVIDEILEIPGFDWIFVGRMDMSGSIGRIGDADAEEIWDAVKKIFSKAKESGIPAGNAIQTPDPEGIQQQLDMGCPIVLLGEDGKFIRSAFDSAVENYRKVTGS